MKVQVKINPVTILEVEGETVQDVFAALAHLEEVFAPDQCGLCGQKGLRHVIREHDGYKFFELRCTNGQCRAKFAFGQPKNVKGGLFPQRKTKEGAWKPNGGWEKYERQGDAAE